MSECLIATPDLICAPDYVKLSQARQNMPMITNPRKKIPKYVWIVVSKGRSLLCVSKVKTLTF